MSDAAATNPLHSIQPEIIFDVDRLPIREKATGCQNRQNMRIVAVITIVLSSLGVLLAAAAITAGALGMTVGILSASALIGGGIGGIAALIATIALSIYLLKCPYWKDPAYMYEQSQRAMAMPFDDIVKNFPWEQIHSQHLISQKALHRKFFEAIKGLDYKAVIAKYRPLILEQRFIEWSALKELLTKEAQDMNSQTYKKTYGDQPVLDGVVNQHDPWFANMAKNGIKNLTYNQIASGFAAERSQGVITDQYIADILPFDEIVIGFSWDQIKSHNIISYNAFKAKFFDRIHTMSYPDVITKYGNVIRAHQFINWSDLKDKLKGEAESMTSAKFKSTYGSQPCADGVVDLGDAWYCKMVLDGIKSLPYSTIRAEYATERQKGIVKNEDIATVLQAQFSGQNQSVQAFYTFQGASFWDVITENIIKCDFFTSFMMTEIQKDKLTILQILQRYGWNIFVHNVLTGEKFRDIFVQEITACTCTQIIQQYGWNVLKYKMALPADLTPYASKECMAMNSFGNILEKFGTSLFDNGVLSYADEAVRCKVLAMCREMTFCAMMDIHGPNLQKYKLLPPHPAIPGLIVRKDQANQRLLEERVNGENAFNEKQRNAEQARDASMQLADQTWHSAIENLKNELSSFDKAQSDLNSQIRQAETRLRDQQQAIVQANQRYEQSLREYDQKIKAAEDKRNLAQDEPAQRMHQTEISSLRAAKNAIMTQHPAQVLESQRAENNCKSSVESLQTVLRTLETNHSVQRYQLECRAAQLKQAADVNRDTEVRLWKKTIADARTALEASNRMASDLCTQTKLLIDTEFHALNLEHPPHPDNEA